MKKYKICPSCNEKNEPTLLECLHCETDLTHVKITDEETEKMHESNLTVKQPVTSLVRLCECGVKNSPNARKCRSCGEDISNISPAHDIEESCAERTFVLCSIDGQYVYKVTTNEVIIGRQSTMSEYLSSKIYVGRSQAKLILDNNELYIEHLSAKNPTYVNNKEITSKTKLSNGDEIGCGGKVINGKRQSKAAYFLVRIL